MEWIDIFGPIKKPAHKPKLPKKGSKNGKIPKVTEKPVILKDETSQKEPLKDPKRIESLEWTDIFGPIKKPANKPKLPANGSNNQHVPMSTEKPAIPEKGDQVPKDPEYSHQYVII